MQKRPIESERLDQMISGIVRRLESMGETDIPSDTIGAIVMETLARIDTVAYVRFASVYKNFQAADDFEDFVSELRPAAGRPGRRLSPWRATTGTRASCARRSGWRGAGSGGPGRTRRSAASSSQGGTVVGRGRTGDGGRPHAETVALAEAGARARGATAYVTLEPCAHTGATPPCAEALVGGRGGAGRRRDRGPRPAGERRAASRRCAPPGSRSRSAASPPRRWR